MNIEKQAVNKLEDLLSQTDLLDPFINRDDKEPSWDGFIYAYKNERKQKSQMFGRAPIQIKGTTIDPRKSDTITYSVSYADISNYREDGGALFFVVYIEDDEHKSVFYAALSPYMLNELLEKHSGKKSFALRLEEFPCDTKDIEDLVINFVQNCQRQSSPTRKNWTLEELADNFGIKQPQIKYRFTDVYKHTDPLDYLFDHFTEMYVPVEITQQEYPIGAAKLEMMGAKVDLPVSVSGKQYYSSYTFERNKDGYRVSIGDGLLTLIMKNDKVTLHFKMSGDLPNQIEQGSFLLAIFESGKIKIGGHEAAIDIESISDKERQNLEDLREKHEWNVDLQTALNLAGVNEVLRFDNWSKQDAFYASQLIKAFVYSEPVKLPEPLQILSIINIANIGIAVLCEKLPSGLYRLSNLFSEELNIFLMLDEKDVPTSQFAVLKKRNILQISNMNYDVLLKSIKRFHTNEHRTVINLLLLEMLSAYDEVNNSELLNASIKLAKWLHKEEPDEVGYLLNWYQSVYRKNPKDKRIDLKVLEQIINQSEGLDVKAGAAVVAGKTEDAKMFIDMMTTENRKTFLQFPIANLL